VNVQTEIYQPRYLSARREMLSQAQGKHQPGLYLAA